MTVEAGKFRERKFIERKRYCKCGGRLSGYNKKNECNACREKEERKYMFA